MPRSPMGIGSIVLGCLAWALAVAGALSRVAHESAGLGFIIAISGAAVAIEAMRVEEATSSLQKRCGFWMNLAAAGFAAGLIVLEIAQRRSTG